MDIGFNVIYYFATFHTNFMAENESFDSFVPGEEDIDIIFSSIEAEIHFIFNGLLESVTRRRDLLLEKLIDIRIRYEESVRIRREEMEDLFALKDRIQQGNRSSLLLSYKVKSSFLEKIENVVGEFGHPLCLPVPVFTCEYSGLLAKIAKLGCVADVENMYIKKNCLYQSIGRVGSGKKEFYNPRSIYLSEKRNELFIVDAGNTRVKILTLPHLELKHEFGRKYFKSPWGVTIWKKSIFVTDQCLNQVFKFSLSSFHLISRFNCKQDEQFNDPRGICVDNNGIIYVAYLTTNRVAVLTADLKLIQYIGLKELVHPHDVKFSTDTLFVLDESFYCVHVFNTDGNILYRLVERGVNSNSFIRHAIFFYLDTFNNIFISDMHRNSIKIFSKSGQLIHSIEVNVPKGLALASNKQLFACNGSDHRIEIY